MPKQNNGSGVSPACLTLPLSDAEIKRQSETSVRELRDARHPGLYLRFHKDRTRGSWYVVRKRRWKKVGVWPSINTKTAQALAASPDGTPVGQAGWTTLGELLTWYRDRAIRDRKLSDKRKQGIKSMIDCHLLPRLRSVPLVKIDRPLLDQQLMWPLQERQSLVYVRQILRVLAVACRQAQRINMLDHNPLEGIKFSDFVQTKIKPKAARLHAMDVEPLLARLAQHFEARPPEAMLALMMLAHGARIGETRLACWRHISLTDRIWIIPADVTKTRTQHTIPLTDQACALLCRYRATQRESPLLFPGRSGQPISEKEASRVFARLGEGKWSSHDLRKLARTGWAELGVDYLIGEMLLNHTLTSIAQAYIQTSADTLKREALELWHRWLDARGFSQIHGQTEDRLTVSTNPAQPTEGAASGDSQELPQRRAGERTGKDEGGELMALDKMSTRIKACVQAKDSRNE